MKHHLLICSLATLAVTFATASTRSGPRQIADLKSFFHGEPTPQPKLPPPAVTAAVSTIPGVTPDQQVEDFFRAFAEALKAREGNRMMARLADSYTIADLPDDHKASDFFVQGVDRTPGPTAIVIQSIETKGKTREVKAEFRYPAKAKVKTFQFDADGKLLASDLFVLKRVEHGL